jgi:predicted nucleic acid-binding protein
VIVADAGVVLEALLFSGRHGQLARQRLASTDVHVPELLDLEVLSALRRLTAQGVASPSQGPHVLRGLRLANIVRHPHVWFLNRVWELRDSVTPYDAVYVAMAERANATLVTLDNRLASAHGPRCRIEVLAV